MTKQQLTEHTIATWQPRLRRRLKKEDAREITKSMTGFFAILAEWSHREEGDGSETNITGVADA